MLGKYKIIFFSLVAGATCILYPGKVYAQTTYTLNTGSAAVTGPFDVSAGGCAGCTYSSYADLYPNTVITSYGNVTGIQINVFSTSSDNMPTAKMYLAQTATATLTAGTYTNMLATAGCTQVYQGANLKFNTSGWVTIPMTGVASPLFDYTAGNLIVIGEADGFTNDQNSNAGFTYNTVNSTDEYWGGTSQANLNGSTGTVDKYREDIKISITGLPTALNVTGITTTSAQLNWTAANPAPASGYNIYYSTTNTAPVVATSPTASVGAGVVTYAINGLTCGTTYYVWVRSISTYNNCTWVALPSFTTASCCSNPTITGQPSTTTQTGCLNFSPTVLSVTALGTTLTYQWYSNAANSNVGGTLIAGTTSSTYTPVTSSAGTTYYYCIVYSQGGCPVTSNVSGAVVVNAPASITAQPSTSSQSICQGGSATAILVTATGTGITYQWYSNVANSNVGGTLIAGATSNSYTPLTTTAGTLYYYCIVTGTAPCGSVTSNVSGAVITNAYPAAVTVSTAGTYCTSTSVTASGGAPGTMYWENTTSGGTSTATPSSSQSVSSSGTYYYGSDNNGCWTYGSATVTINTPISITTQPSSTSQTVCQLSTPTTLSVTVSGTSPAYQWYQNAANSNVGGSSIAGANSNTYTPSSSTIGTLYYYCIITSPAPCSSSVTTSVSGAVNITSAPSAITVSTAGTYCTNTTLTATGGAGGTMYWENTTSNGTSTATPSASQLVSSTGTYYFGSYNGSCWTYGSATVTINTAVNITTQPSTTTQNGGVNFSATALTVAATGTGLSYQWYSNASNSNSGGTSLGSANGGQTNSYTPQTGSIGTLYYYCVVSGASPCGSVTSNVSGAVIVSPIPNAPVASAATYIDCNSIFANWAASSGATSYYLDVSPNSSFSSFVTGFNNVNVGNTTSAFVYNLTAGTTYYYRVRASNSSGTSGNSNTITVTTSAAGSCAGSWVALGTGNAVHGNGTNGIVYALTTSWPLKLYVGGSFSDVYNSTGGTVAASNVALWTATPGSSAGTWTALTGGGVNGQINALAFNPNAGTKGILYVGGQFTIACTTGTNVAVSNLAQYDVGTGVWSNVGGGVTGGAAIGYAYQELDGGFSLSDQTANSNCTCTGGGFPVQALAVDASGNLYVGGNFTTAGTGGGAVSATNIAEFHPSSAGSASGTWYKLPSSGSQGLTGSVYATSNTYYTAPTVYALNIDQSGNIWVGGQFTTAGSINANNIAEWIPTGTGTGTWYGLGSGTTTTTQGVLTEAYGNASGYYQQFSEAPGVFSIVSNGSTIYVGGDFASVNGTGTSVAYNLAQWTVSGAGTGTWSYVGTASNHQGVQGPSFDGAEVNALYYSSPFLYIGGDFQDVNNSALEVNNAAMWSGATFAEMPTGSTPGFDPAFFTAYAIAGLAGVGPNDAGVLYMGGYNTPNPYTASMTEVNSIVQWGDPDVILPIKILTFNAQYNPDGNVVNLNWETATEVNNKEFTIEKTLDGTNWAFVANIKGSGTSSIPISYTSIDEQPYSGTSYYRLKQTDYDGNFTYSELRPVTIGIQQNKVEVIPNPARNYTNIIFGTSEPGDAVLALYDCTGRLIYSRQIITVKGVNSAELEISNYTNGVYFVTLTSELQNYTDKLIISH